MAMNLRPRGGATRRTRPGNRPVYEDFTPTTEWKHEEGADIVLYHLPGFSKEQIRIIAESKGVLKVKGERHVTSNRWSRFEEQVVVADDCNMSEVRAKFEAGILRIIMPKKAIAIDKKHPVVEQQAVNATTPLPKPPSSSLPRPDVQPNPPTELPSKQAALPTVDETPQFGTRMNPPQPNTQQDAPTSRAPLKPTIDFKPQPQSDHDNIQQHIPDYLKPKVVQDRKVHDDGSSSTHIADYSKGRLLEKHDDKEHKNKYVDALGDQKEERNYGLSYVNRLDNQLNVIVSRLSNKLDEDGHLLVNVGAAILVIIALGMYISYSFGLRD